MHWREHFTSTPFTSQLTASLSLTLHFFSFPFTCRLYISLHYLPSYNFKQHLFTALCISSSHFALRLLNSLYLPSQRISSTPASLWIALLSTSLRHRYYWQNLTDMTPPPPPLDCPLSFHFSLPSTPSPVHVSDVKRKKRKRRKK